MQTPENFAYVILVDTALHTDEMPFCFTDVNCPCHEDHETIAKVAQWVVDGLITEDEATNFIAGRML